MTIQEMLAPLLVKIQEMLVTLLGIVKSYPIIIIAFSWIAALLFMSLKSKSPDALFSQEYFNFIIIGLPILYIIITGLRLGSALNDKTQVAKLVGLAILFIGIIGGTWYLNAPRGNAEPILTSDIAEKIMFFLNVIGVAIVVFGLIIFARLLKDVAYSFEGWIGIIMRVIFFIPCMLSDLLSYIGGEFARSPFVVYVLIAIEALLIFAYFYLPKIISKLAIASGGENILNNPVSLGKRKSLKSIGNLYIKDGIKPDLGSYNKFSVSMWFYIKSMPSNTYPYNEDAIILNLENHPKVVYNGSKNKCIVYLNNTPHEFKIPLQKWVNLVVVFGSGNIDMFLDGQLIKTVNRDASINLAYTDTIVVGQDSGLQGKIANITYYQKAIPKLEIIRLYELNRNKDPPINYNNNI
jgi:hypothetical protein